MKKLVLIIGLIALSLAQTAEARGGKHYGYLGGHYTGGLGSSHKGGHYKNSHTGNHYTHHRE
jgi:hypothetical protein